MEETKPVVEQRRGVRRRAIVEEEEAIVEVKLKAAEKLSKRPESTKRSESIVNLRISRFYSVLLHYRKK